VLFGVKSHEKASFVEVYTYPASSIADRSARERGGLLYYQWYAADPKQRGFSNDISRLSKIIAANNLGR